ncbi:MAG: MBL fold metallo-hydrolase [Candidatus Heimdallarchaeota archaeon]
MNLNPSLEISAKELHDRLQAQEDLALIDVRSPQAYYDWNLLDSKNIPLRELFEKRELGAEFKNRKIITVCTRGNDSNMAAKILRSQGISALSLHGGLKEWSSILDPVEIPTKEPNLRVTQFRRIAKGCLSYIISHEDEAVVIDPVYDIQPYMDHIDNEGLTVTHVLDTHCHADHVSGARELSSKMDAELRLSTFDPFDFEFTPMENNDSIQVGNYSITAMHTPGHTKGSTTIRIKHQGIFTGDTVFADGIGRPDLADKVEEFASDLFHTLTTTIAKLPANEFIAAAHHGKFAMNHFHKPIITTIEDFTQDPVHKTEKDTFVTRAVDSIKKIQKPPSYRTIVQINCGRLFLAPDQIQELEIGPNRCAMG